MALRVLVGDPIDAYPPGKLSFWSALLCWAEMLLGVAVLTPRVRHRLWEACNTVSLEMGIRLSSDAGKGESSYGN